MGSINTNYAASSALRALQNYSKDLDVTQTRIATGYKINSASDNASIWNVAQGLRSDIASTEATQTGLTTAVGKVKVAGTAMDTVQSILGQMKTQLSNAIGASTDVKASIQITIGSLQTQLKTVINSATVDGANLLRDTGFTVVTGNTGGGATGLGTTTDATTLVPLMTAAAGTGGTLGTATAAASVSTSGTSILTMTVVGTTDTQLGVLQSELSAASTIVDTSASTLAALQNRLVAQNDFITAINQVKSTALGSLVNADLNAESAKLTSLQTKQQLAVSALQIANNSESYILRLFQ